jgi:beta-lactamase regulating signal transducer with metallopeptidase domain
MISIDEIMTGRLWLFLLVQGTACLAVGLAASHALRHRPARAHQVLLTALLASVLMPILYLSVGRLGLGILAPTVPALPMMAETSVLDTLLDTPASDDRPAVAAVDESGPGPVDQAVAPVSPSRTAVLRVPWDTIVVICWSVATGLLFVRLALRFLLGWRVVHAAQPLDSEPIRRAVDAAKGKLGVNKSIRIRRSGRVHSPVIWCWSREPVLLVQENASDAGHRADWTGVFCHEVSHWRRLDHLAGLFTEVLRAAFPWHPLLWWAKGRLLCLSEQACDDWVLATGQNEADYAEMLLGLAAQRQMAFLPTVIGKEKTMHARIRRIIKDNGSDPRLGTRWALAVGALALCTTVGVAVAQRRPAEPEPMDRPPTRILQERHEIELRELPEVDQQRVAMKRVLERLMQQAQEKKQMLREGNDLSEQERQIQQIELKLLMEQIEQMRNRSATLDREAPARREPAKIAPREPLEPKFEARFDSLRQRHEELVQRAQKTERQIEELRDDQGQETDELKLRLKEVHAEMVDVAKEMEGLKRAQADDLKRRKLDDLKRAQAEVRRETVVRKPAAEEQDREEKLQYARQRAEKLARALKENPEMDPEKAEVQEKLLQAIREQIRALEQEPRGLEGKKDSPVPAPRREYRIEEEVKIEKQAPDGPPRVIQEPAAGPRLEARVYAVEHISPERMRAIVEALLEEPETVTLYANARKAAVVATAENHHRLERIIRIVDVPEEDVNQDGGKSLRGITLKYFSPPRMQSLLRAILGSAGEVSLGGGRTLFVTTTSADMKRVESVARALDIPPDGRISAAEVEELRRQMRGLGEQMRQIQDRLDRMAEQERTDKAREPADRR